MITKKMRKLIDKSFSLGRKKGIEEEEEFNHSFNKYSIIKSRKIIIKITRRQNDN